MRERERGRDGYNRDEREQEREQGDRERESTRERGELVRAEERATQRQIELKR